MLRLKAERLARGWSQLQLAARARVHPSDVSRYENSHSILLGHRQRIAEALEVPEERLEDVVRLKVVSENG